ncbi:Mov34/MPN/PAD-1 family protein [Halostagnicola kamekurae]|uniref:Proteasome lid subunit RPN8/RPN11, contains Jab1/MPN metalloenzyme (JAMM) motif n=1 Tax=Halostagnicola kamekurae TaxID=619731 RepID=A0A1I6QSK9_9EURY|nr:Mov34/MPN/PAD-1 family protein [Halostagnicola kamekurae]SFS55360.1 Proteasome lid subunit RPN8/RPN11, contains Jab1/MPN metalloenzyme (JAMM) motif [Halostagnicola kamekurae]
MGLFDALFRSSEVLGIAEETLEFALESSAETHPNEYMGFLRGTEASALGLERDGLVITDVLVVPGTETNSVSATVRTNMIPNDVKALGSIHSHPNGVVRPSDADLETFGRGSVHVIIGAPYQRSDWRAFDSQGKPTQLNVLEVELPDAEEFFDFTQADIDEDLQWE